MKKSILTSIIFLLISGSAHALNAGWSSEADTYSVVDDAWCHGPGRNLYHGDFNGDGLQDILCHNASSGRRRIDFAQADLDGFYGTDWDSLNYSSASRHWCTNPGENIYVGDFNGDRRDDLLCHVGRGFSNHGRRRIDFANESGTFFGTDFNSEDYPDASQHWCTNRGENIYVGDFNGDRRDDLLCHVGRGYSSYGRRRVDFANNVGTFFGTDFNSEDYPDASQHWCTNRGESIYVGNFNGDRRDDLLCHVERGHPNSGRRRIDYANNVGTFFGTDFNSQDYRDASQHWCTNAGESIHAGDFNGDGRDDLLCFGHSSGLMRIDHANNKGTFFGTNASSREHWCGGPDDWLHVEDFNGDGRVDLLCHNPVSGYRGLRYTNRDGDLFSVCSAGSEQGDGALPPVGVHFVVLSDPNHPDVSDRWGQMPTETSIHTHPISGEALDQSVDPEAYFRAEVDVINEYMHDEWFNDVCDGDDCLKFEYLSHTFFSETSGSSCDALLKLGSPPNAKWARDCNDRNDCGEGSVATTGWSGTLREAIEECDDPRLWKAGALNFYIFDQCNWDPTSSSGVSNSACTRYISNGKNFPRTAVAAAYERLLRGPATADRADARGIEPHEIGHVFGLMHTFEGCQISTNAMHKQPEGPYCGTATPLCTTGGDRAAGFYTSVVPWDGDDQCTTVNQITKMIGKARDAQEAWSCQ